MGQLPTQTPSGLVVTGDTEEEGGSGFRAIGKGVQGLMPFGCLATGRREGEAGFGTKDIGDNVEQFKVMSKELRV